MSELRKYGELLTNSKAVPFSLYKQDGLTYATSATVTFAVGDVLISKDGGAFGNVLNLPIAVGSGWHLILTAAELTAARVIILISDATATQVWLDSDLTIETYGHASAMHQFDFGIASVAQTADIADQVPNILNTTALGNVGIDWANIENKSTTNLLANTDTRRVANTTNNDDMRGTELAALAVDFSAARGAYLDELAAANIPNDLTIITAYVDELESRLTAVRAGYLDANISSRNAIAPPTVAQITADIETNLTKLQTVLDDTNELQVNQGNFATAVGFATDTALAIAQNDLNKLTGADGATLASLQPNYAPNTVIPDEAGTAPTVSEITTDIDTNSTKLAEITSARMSELDAGVGGKMANEIDLIKAVVTNIENGTIKKNTAGATIIRMFDSTTGNPLAAGVVVTGVRALDTGAYASMTATISVTGSKGNSHIAWTAADTNGTKVVSMIFSAAGADDVELTLQLT